MKKLLTLIFLSLLLPLSLLAANIELKGEVDIEKKLIKGFLWVTADNKTIRFKHESDIKLLLEEGLNYNSKEDYHSIFVPNGKPIIISFIKNFKEGFDSFEEDYISLYSSILPEFLDNTSAAIKLKVDSKYELLLNGFTDIQARNIDNNTKEYLFTYDKLPKKVHLIASPLFKIYETKFDKKGVKVFAYLFKEDEALAPTLLQKASEYLKYYELLLQIEYPYDSLVIVEDTKPSGHAIEGFAVFGKQIIRRDFVLNRSLGHEILHQWIGCLVESDKKWGNWVEALTTYFADYNYEKNKVHYRKNILNELQSYDERELFPIKDFKANFSKIDQLIGYGKALLLLHTISKKLGEREFLAKIITFLKKYSGSKATFKDLLSHLDMSESLIDFNLNSTLPEQISFHNVNINNDDISFNIILKNGSEREDIYYTVKYTDGIKLFRTSLENNKERIISIPNAKNVEYILIDNEYDSIRKLDNSELTPVFYNIFNSNSVTMVGDNYDSFRKLKKISTNIKNHIAPKKLYKTTLYNKDIILDLNDIIHSNITSLISSEILGKLQMGKSDAYIIKNPHSDKNNYILILHNFNENLFARLLHYRNYEYILFNENKVEREDKPKGQNGILVYKK